MNRGSNKEINTVPFSDDDEIDQIPHPSNLSSEDLRSLNKEGNFGANINTAGNNEMHLSQHADYSEFKGTMVSSKVNVQTVVRQYHSTEDNDLRYMTIKEELPISEICENLSEYVRHLLIPVLMEESDAEIVNLVSLQVFPHTAELCLLNAKSGTWFDDIIIHPLIQRMGEGRTAIAIQTLKTVSRKVSEYNVRLGTRWQLIEEFLRKCDNSVLSIEALYYLIQCYFDLHHRVPPLIFDHILKIIRRAPFDNISKLLIRESVNRASLDAISTVGSQMNLQELEAASEHWYRMAPIVIDIFHSKLIPSLTNHETRASALQILLNFKPFYTIKRLNGNTFLGTNNEMLLVQSLQHLVHESSNLEKDVPANDEIQEDDSDTDFDPAQTAYLAELPSDEEIEFEDEIAEHSQTKLLSQETSIPSICKGILAELSDAPRAYENLPPIANSLCKRGTEDLSSLPQLQMALETLSQSALLRPPPNLPWSQISQDLVLPRFIYDKTFVQKLKAGNLTQSIDEGATLRASAQTTLQLLLPLIDFKTICLALEYELRTGIRDTDPAVKQLAIKVIDPLLAAHYSEIIALEYEWYVSLLSGNDDRDLAAQALWKRLREQYPAN